MNLRCVEMRFVLLAVSLFFASNSYAAVINNSYIYPDDSEEHKTLKERLKKAEDGLSEQYIRLFKINRKDNYDGYDKDEVVYRVGDFSKKDVGAKIGMTREQVLNKSYWGRPDNTYIDVDMKDKIELWTYQIYGERKGVTQRMGLLFFINGKLTHIVR